MRRCHLRALALLSLATLALGCSAEPEPEPPRRVFLITVDTLRADHLGWHGYPRDTSPHLDEWTERGVVFERAIVQWPKTGPSFASMFTSLYPHTTGLINRADQTIPDSVLALPRWFQGLGYKTVAVISNPVLKRELGWDRGFDRYEQTWVDDATLETIESTVEFRHHIRADRVNELAEPLLASFADEERLFVWLHYTDPHAPYLLQPGTKNPFLGDEHYTGDEVVDLTGAEGRAIGERRDLKYYVAQYDANVRVTDRAIGDMLDYIADLGMQAGSLFVLTSDHGEELAEHGIPFEHGPVPYNSSVHVPLAIVGEPWAEAGRRVERPVELIGLFPTLIDLLGEPMPEVLEGRSWTPLLGGAHQADRDPAPVAFADAGAYQRHLRSIQDEEWHLVLRPPNQEGEKVVMEIYHLPSDPLQLNDVAEEFPDVKRRLARRLRNWIREAPPSINPHTDAARKALEAMGYL